LQNFSVHHPGDHALAWRAGERSTRYFTLFWLTALLFVAIFGLLAAYDWRVLDDRHFGVDTLPRYTPFYYGRWLAAFALSLLIVGQFYLNRAPDARLDRGNLSRPQRAIAYALMILALAATALFVADPILFNRFSLEDGPVEWPSALLPLASSVVLLYAFFLVLRSRRRDLRRRLALLGTAGAALVLFCLGMEEISWMQRIFQIDTPAMFAGNMQHEMNFHNMNSYAIGGAHKLAGFACLILLPFMYETAPRTRLFELFSDFIPSRFVVAASAILAGFNYNTWNFFPTEMAMMMSVLIVLFYAMAAHDRNDRAEMILFTTVAVLITAEQIVFLAWGDNFVRRWDVTEYKELFIAIGLSLFAWETTRRLRARYAEPAPAH
jgi:hypothetical protein